MNKTFLVAAIQLGLLTGCGSTSLSNSAYEDTSYTIKNSPLAIKPEAKKDAQAADIEPIEKRGIKKLQSLHQPQSFETKNNGLYEQFSDSPTLMVTAEKLPLGQFINYVMGDVLQLSYIVTDQLANSSKNVTINITEKISPRALMALLNEQLEESGNELILKDDIYYVTPIVNGGSRYAIGIGADLEDIPTNANNILQIVPITYEISRFAMTSIRDFTPAQVIHDIDQNSLFIRGRYSDVARTLDVFRYLDKPANRGKHVSLFELTYIDSTSFIEQLKTLLKTEGINVGDDSGNNANLVFVPLDQVGSVAVFASDETLLNRAKYWAKTLDKPLQGAELNYFIYYPKFARAADLASSLQPLISGGGGRSAESSRSSSTKRDLASAEEGTSRQVNTNAPSFSNTSELVVDERSNAMIFNMDASQYNQLLPLIKQLDVLPKQILLEVVIAEVTLTGDFKKGVEFFFSKGNSSGGTKGAFGVADLGGMSYLWKDGGNQIQVSAFEENKFVNVLSNPTLLVRDGVEANITVGTDIPVVTSTVDTEGDGTKVTETVQYRKTGVDVSVTPTVNSRGVVIMNIVQSISNQTDTSAGSSSPSIFDRSITTEVIADSGQTIILGGIISEDKNSSQTKVPFLGDIPVLGHLFRYDGDASSKTELVMLVTPRIIERNDEWQGLIEQFGQGFENLKLPTNK
ncbi:general secretion pathway protein GspD [Vibrio rotiferianus]|uniref:secretin N-terminal domain-containing protein n=1 Tax=Vibrio rotiferianus TaxID=190895 RepID=UPI001110C3E3|nr:secretin N-terminal domain-containing protein [Vibrio rotiferianus]TMX44370.1 general secretion pathway protein GspD [Vibrio rotiferianus]TMX48765.1 general secretion pathway protein GspD [Vibrio rotiferianus]TMX61991.1 general secretion pathway protein GspD [Vibrio rotiferianus]